MKKKKGETQFQKGTGGKLMLFVATIPNIGPGKLVNREDLKLLGTAKEHTLLIPESEYYKEFAVQCYESQVSVSLYCFGVQYMDLGSLASMPQFTGGSLYYYPGFKAERDGEKFYRDFYRDLTRTTGTDSFLAVRTSKCLSVAAHYGNFFVNSPTILVLPHTNPDHGYTFQFHLNQAIKTSHIGIQIAILYTLPTGEKKVRVFTKCLPVSSQLADIYRGVDQEALATFLSKHGIKKKYFRFIKIFTKQLRDFFHPFHFFQSKKKKKQLSIQL